MNRSFFTAVPVGAIALLPTQHHLARWIGVAAFCGLLLTGCRPDNRMARFLVLVTVDTLRADHLGCYGYFRPTSPEIDRLALESLVFDNVVTPMPTTLPAHTSLMTSMLPATHGVDSNSRRFESGPGRRTLAQMLASRGYATAAIVSAYPLYRDSGIDAGFEDFIEPDPHSAEPGELRVDETGERIHSARATATTRAALSWLDTATPDKPFFLWVHYWDPHSPYQPPAEYDSQYQTSPQLTEFLEKRGVQAPAATRGRPDVAARGPRRFGPVSPVEVNNSYDGEVRFVDEQIGRMLAKLRQLDIYDDAAIVLTADHGEGLYQHGWLGHGRIHNEQLFVPLIIKPQRGRHRAPGRSGRPGSLIDVVPTLFDLMELELSAGERRQSQGRSLVDDPPDEPFVLVQQTPVSRGPRALLTSRWKLLAFDNSPPRLFDLEADPFELRDLSQQHPRVTRRMARQLEATLRAAGHAEVESRDRPALEALRDLGYVD